MSTPRLFPALFALSLPFLLVACKPDPEDTDDGRDTDTDTDTPDDSGDTGPGTTAWNYLVYMDGDNSLETYVTHDLNELEIVGSTDDVNVLVLADRIDGREDDDGDWTGTRYYKIIKDNDQETVSSPVLTDLGELNMADPQTLADFLDWASTNYPADHTALIMWNHGSGWDFTGESGDATDATDAATDSATPPPPSIAEDSTSNGATMSIAKGEFQSGLAGWVTAHGRLDVLGFDACNMASWEVAYAVAPYSKTMAAAETTVGAEGYRYDQVLAAMIADPTLTGAEVADLMARTEVEGGEWSHSAVDLDLIDELAVQIDAFALALMASDDAGQSAWDHRDDMLGADAEWAYYFMDMGSLVGVVETLDPTLASQSAAVSDALAAALIGSYSRDEYADLTGLSIFFDPRYPTYNAQYSTGVGATWAVDTHWDDYVLSIETGGDNTAMF